MGVPIVVDGPPSKWRFLLLNQCLVVTIRRGTRSVRIYSHCTGSTFGYEFRKTGNQARRRILLQRPMMALGSMDLWGEISYVRLHAVSSVKGSGKAL
jgi:hypothetical protein